MFAGVQKLAYLSVLCPHLFIGVHSGLASTAAIHSCLWAGFGGGGTTRSRDGAAPPGKCADKTEHVILKPRPVRASGEAVWWEMVDIRQFAQGLSEGTL